MDRRKVQNHRDGAIVDHGLQDTIDKENIVRKKATNLFQLDQIQRNQIQTKELNHHNFTSTVSHGLKNSGYEGKPLARPIHNLPHLPNLGQSDPLHNGIEKLNSNQNQTVYFQDGQGAKGKNNLLSKDKYNRISNKNEPNTYNPVKKVKDYKISEYQIEFGDSLIQKKAGNPPASLCMHRKPKFFTFYTDSDQLCLPDDTQMYFDKRGKILCFHDGTDFAASQKKNYQECV